ncbi:hypothetical protein KIPB_016704, partial [Kipferlia bialata]
TPRTGGHLTLALPREADSDRLHVFLQQVENAAKREPELIRPLRGQTSVFAPLGGSVGAIGGMPSHILMTVTHRLGRDSTHFRHSVTPK